jgi:hypothetical protein
VAKDYIKEGIEKTAFIKSFPSLNYFLERGLLNKGQRFVITYRKTIDAFNLDLRAKLTEEDIKQLRNINYAVPAGSALIFVRGFERPALGFNLDKIPDFSRPGWLFHATQLDGIKHIIKDGEIRSPLETVYSKKNIFSTKFWNDTRIIKRISDGVSLAFQDIEKYHGYVRFAGADVRLPTGGFFIFPIKDVLKEDLILDFEDTIDSFPEIDLRDKSYKEHSPEIIKNAVYILRKTFPEWLSKFEENKRQFSQAKKEVETLINIRKITETGREKSIEIKRKGEKYRGLTGKKFETLVSDEVLYAKRFEYPDHMDIRKNTQESLGSLFLDRMTAAYDKDPKSEEFLTISDIYREKEDEIEWNFFKEQAEVSAKGELYVETLGGGILPKWKIDSAVKAVQEDDFFSFSILNLLAGGLGGDEKEMTPELKHFPSTDTPEYFEGTIFAQDIRYYVEGEGNFGTHVLVLTLMKEKAGSKADDPIKYLTQLKKMKPKDLNKLFKRAAAQLIKALPKIVENRYRTHKKTPCTIQADKGVLFLDQDFNDPETMMKAAEKKVPMITAIPYERTENASNGRIKEIVIFVKESLGLKDLPISREIYNQEGYLYTSSGKLILHKRRDGSEEKIY